ncbi:MAG: ATPase domain-containing protein [Nitrososphaerota archaeon]
MSPLSRWIPTGCPSLDRALEGGLPPSGLTLLYGEAETGKTSLAMQCAVNSARMSYKTLFIDAEGVFSPERLAQIASNDYERVSEEIIIVRPSTFSEHAAVINDLDKYIGRGFGLIVFDTITSLYRSEIRDRETAFRLNRELNRQVATLAHLAKTLEISVLLNGQVRSVMEFGELSTEPVATRVLKFWSTAVVNLTRTGKRNIIKATVEKSGGKEKRLTFYLIIEKDGVHDYDHKLYS